MSKGMSSSDWMDGRKVVNHAKTIPGMKVREGDGDHVVMNYGNSSMVCVTRPMGKGLACKIMKWFKSLGLAMFFGFVLWSLLTLNNHPELLAALGVVTGE